MTQETNITENYTVASEKKSWSAPAFEIINNDRIKSGITHKTYAEGGHLPSSYAS